MVKIIITDIKRKTIKPKTIPPKYILNNELMITEIKISAKNGNFNQDTIFSIILDFNYISFDEDIASYSNNPTLMILNIPLRNFYNIIEFYNAKIEEEQPDNFISREYLNLPNNCFYTLFEVLDV